MKIEERDRDCNYWEINGHFRQKLNELTEFTSRIILTFFEMPAFRWKALLLMARKGYDNGRIRVDCITTIYDRLWRIITHLERLPTLKSTGSIAGSLPSTSFFTVSEISLGLQPFVVSVMMIFPPLKESNSDSTFVFLGEEWKLWGPFLSRCHFGVMTPRRCHRAVFSSEHDNGHGVI